MNANETTSTLTEASTPYLAALVIERVDWRDWRSALTAIGQFLQGRRGWCRTHCWLWVNGVMYNPCFTGYYVQSFDYSWLETMVTEHNAEVYFFVLDKAPKRNAFYQHLNVLDFLRAFIAVPSFSRGWVCSEYVAELYSDRNLEDILNSGVLITPDDLLRYTMTTYPGYLNTRKRRTYDESIG